MAISAAVGATLRFDDLLELIADEACKTLGAASLSISRLEPDGKALRTLVNVGDLGPDEERRPSDETYQLSDFPQVLISMEAGFPFLSSVDDPGTDPAERQLLASLGKESAVTLPIMSDAGLWGELWATTAPGAQRFTWEDLSFLFAVTGHVAAGIAHAERLGRLADYAYTDELTRLFNRRKLQETLEAALAQDVREGQGRPVSLVMIDVDDLKAVNDTYGHEAGDRVLLKVAHGLVAAVSNVRDALVCHLGGDGFGILLDGHGMDVAQTVAQLAADRLASVQPDAISISSGVASGLAGTVLPSQLLRAADAALYQAKQTRPGSVVVAGAGAPQPPAAPRRRSVRDRSEPLAGLLDHTLHRLDQAASDTAADRLGIVAAEVARRLGADAWAIAQAAPAAKADRLVMRTVQAWHADAEHRAERLGVAQLTVAPTSARLQLSLLEAETARLVLPDDPEWPLSPVSGWPAGMLIAGARSPAGGWLLGLDMLDPDDLTRAAIGAVRLLVGEAVRGTDRIADSIPDPAP